MTISPATLQDAPALVAIINSAYRGDGSKAGWTTEADIIAGEARILLPALQELMQRTGVTFLKAMNEAGELTGTVFLEKRGMQLYLGMLSVNPQLQAKGTGKELMLAAEAHARAIDCTSITMRVINLRTELIAWYKRRGYSDTGRIEQYTAPDYEKIISPFHFIIMEKNL